MGELASDTKALPGAKVPSFGIVVVLGLVAFCALFVLIDTSYGLYLPGFFSLGGWLAAVAFIVFAFVGLQAVWREESRPRAVANPPHA